MSKVTACRACLATDVKLYNIQDTAMTAAYETVTGLTIPKYDILPQYLCAYCRRVVQRSLALRQQCLSVQKTMYLLALDQLLTQEQLQLRKVSSLAVSRTITTHYVPSDHEGLLDIKDIKMECGLFDDPLVNAPVDWDRDHETHLQLYCKQEEQAEIPIEVITKQTTKSIVIKTEKLDVYSEGLTENNTHMVMSEHSEAVIPSIGDETHGNTCDESVTTNQEVVVVKKPHTCEECGKTFCSRFMFFHHVRRHMGPKPHKCDMCPKSFSKGAFLIAHKRTHTGEKPYRCDICEKVFSEKSSLKQHKRIHLGLKPFKCELCDRSFTQSTTLKKHRGTHTEFKPFKCLVCDKSFKQSSHLSVHKQIHTQEKLYKCDECGKSFSLKLYLRAHKRTHTGETPFKCDICGKLFKRQTYLAKHKRTHTGAKPYKCDLCTKSFAVKLSLTVHKRKKHVTDAS